MLVCGTRGAFGSGPLSGRRVVLDQECQTQVGIDLREPRRLPFDDRSVGANALPGNWIGEAGAATVGVIVPSTVPTPAVNNGGALPATAKLDAVK